ncbi:hypothetical protein, conserved [Babesia bigemina]|uniref:3'-5' exonuclease domain-containing protein n=1 Tax=Babesia bigemina TaxID=5866 RepID=A0A061D3B5_BABBI|nr:hypothetical protein, conserved [Babesia bigemina]CDR94577.1 hypothetical protein, conserved [Babesia bigemina]|eukprot:XP_012766763.1 hypothetical protein, conserved [Babesia bigemina]
MGAPPRRWPIYATKRMAEVLPQLCAVGDRHTLVANVVFHFVGSSNVPSERMSRYFKHGYLQALNYVYSDRSFKEPPLALSTVQHAREIIFSPLNRRLVREVSPAMRPQPLEDLAGNIEAALYRWEDFIGGITCGSRFAMYNTRAKESVCANGLFRAVGAREFPRTVTLLRLNHKLLSTLEAITVNEYFVDAFAAATEVAQLEAVDMALMLLQQQDRPDLYAPFVAGSWRAADVLQKVVESESKTALEHFFASAPQSTIAQACDMLRSTDVKTGMGAFQHMTNGCRNLITRRSTDAAAITGAAVPSANHLELGDDEDISDFGDYTNTPHMVDTVADLIHMLKALKRYAQQHAGARDGLVSVHIERDAAAFCTARSAFIVDLLVGDPLYQSTLFQLLAWLWSNSGLLKVGHNLLPKVAKLASQFDSPFTAYVNMVDLRNKRSSSGTSVGDEAVTRFRETGDSATPHFNVSAGISRTLKGLLQEYSIAVPQFDRHWGAEQRPICPSRARYMEQLATGILSIERQLREEGWMPTDFCDLSSYDNGRACLRGTRAAHRKCTAVSSCVKKRGRFLDSHNEETAHTHPFTTSMDIKPKSTAQPSEQLRPRLANWHSSSSASTRVTTSSSRESGGKRVNGFAPCVELPSGGQRRRCNAYAGPALPYSESGASLSRNHTPRCGQTIVRKDAPRGHHDLFLWDDESGLIIKYPMYEEQQNSRRSPYTCPWSLVPVYPENKKDDDDVQTDTRVLNWSLQVVEQYLKAAIEIAKSENGNERKPA